jgi:beta-lactamase superfamily II metal-dependent hydrolase
MAIASGCRRAGLIGSRGFKKIDVAALTQAHQDHVGGLSAILENFGVGRLWIGREVNNLALAKLEALARERHIRIEYETRGTHFSLDKVQGEFLRPGNIFRRSRSGGEKQRFAGIEIEIPKKNAIAPW